MLTTKEGLEVLARLENGNGVSLAAGKLYTDGTDIYVFGSGSLAKI